MRLLCGHLTLVCKCTEHSSLWPVLMPWQMQHMSGEMLYTDFFQLKFKLQLISFYIFIFFPGICALAFAGIEYAGKAWMQGETSWSSPAQIQIYMIKTLIPVSGFLLIIAGISEVFRSIIALQTGQWPERLVAAEETEKILMRKNSEGVLVEDIKEGSK